MINQIEASTRQHCERCSLVSPEPGEQQRESVPGNKEKAGGGTEQTDPEVWWALASRQAQPPDAAECLQCADGLRQARDLVGLLSAEVAAAESPAGRARAQGARQSPWAAVGGPRLRLREASLRLEELDRLYGGRARWTDTNLLRHPDLLQRMRGSAQCVACGRLVPEVYATYKRNLALWTRQDGGAGNQDELLRAKLDGLESLGADAYSKNCTPCLRQLAAAGKDRRDTTVSAVDGARWFQWGKLEDALQRQRRH